MKIHLHHRLIADESSAMTLEYMLQRKRCLEEKRCMSMPSVSLSPTSNDSSSSHRSRLLRLQERRFRHRFPKLPPDEKLLNYFSCALVSDILLQGHLFITKNHFAFYSNIFGHKTVILIPVADVVKVTKEKTAKIIPNAVGVYTETDKYVFGSMLSRDSAYRVIQQTWIQTTDAGLCLPDDSESEVSPAAMLLADEESSVSSGASGHVPSDDPSVAATSGLGTTPEIGSNASMLLSTPTPLSSPSQKGSPLFRHKDATSCSFNFAKGYMIKLEEVIVALSKLPRTSLLFVMSTVLLILLFFSTTVLLYRIHLVHQRLVENDLYTSSSLRFGHISGLSGSDFASLVRNLEERIQGLSEIRKTLEELLLVANKFKQVPRMPVNNYIT